MKTLTYIDKPLCIMKYLYSDVTERIIGASMKIHRYLGNGFQEVIYQRCLEIELRASGLKFEREKEQNVFYESVCVGTRRVDFLVEEKILVELKAIIKLEKCSPRPSNQLPGGFQSRSRTSDQFRRPFPGLSPPS